MKSLNNLSIGDIVMFSESNELPKRKFAITHIDPASGYISGIDSDGNLFADKNPDKWIKTDDYCPVVEELLDVLKTY